MEMVTRLVDTLAILPTGGATRFTYSERGAATRTGATSPYPYFDEWAVTSDGSVAILRGREYRIDWIGADGTRSQSPRLSYPWVAVPEQEKARLVDSINTVRREGYEAAVARRAALIVSPRRFAS